MNGGVDYFGSVVSQAPSVAVGILWPPPQCFFCNVTCLPRLLSFLPAWLFFTYRWPRLGVRKHSRRFTDLLPSNWARSSLREEKPDVSRRVLQPLLKTAMYRFCLVLLCFYPFYDTCNKSSSTLHSGWIYVTFFVATSAFVVSPWNMKSVCFR